MYNYWVVLELSEFREICALLSWQLRGCSHRSPEMDHRRSSKIEQSIESTFVVAFALHRVVYVGVADGR